MTLAHMSIESAFIGAAAFAVFAIVRSLREEWARVCATYPKAPLAAPTAHPSAVAAPDAAHQERDGVNLDHAA